MCVFCSLKKKKKKNAVIQFSGEDVYFATESFFNVPLTISIQRSLWFKAPPLQILRSTSCKLDQNGDTAFEQVIKFLYVHTTFDPLHPPSPSSRCTFFSVWRRRGEGGAGGEEGEKCQNMYFPVAACLGAVNDGRNNSRYSWTPREKHTAHEELPGGYQIACLSGRVIGQSADQLVTPFTRLEYLKGGE